LDYGLAIDVWSLGCICFELFVGLPIFPGQNEHRMLYRIAKTLGPPPNWMLREGKKKNKFYKRSKDGSFLLKSDREFAKGEKTGSIPPFRKYFQSHAIDTIVMDYEYKEDLTPEQLQEEQTDRRDFVDMLLCMLMWDPNKRWLPQQLQSHVFLGGKHRLSTGPPRFVPPAFQRSPPTYFSPGSASYTPSTPYHRSGGYRMSWGGPDSHHVISSPYSSPGERERANSFEHGHVPFPHRRQSDPKPGNKKARRRRGTMSPSSPPSSSPHSTRNKRVGSTDNPSNWDPTYNDAELLSSETGERGEYGGADLNRLSLQEQANMYAPPPPNHYSGAHSAPFSSSPWGAPLPPFMMDDTHSSSQQPFPSSQPRNISQQRRRGGGRGSSLRPGSYQGATYYHPPQGNQNPSMYFYPQYGGEGPGFPGASFSYSEGYNYPTQSQFNPTDARIDEEDEEEK